MKKILCGLSLLTVLSEGRAQQGAEADIKQLKILNATFIKVSPANYAGEGTIVRKYDFRKS